MLVAPSKDVPPAATEPAVAGLLRSVSPDRLRGQVEALAFPRHYLAEPEANARAKDLLLELLRGFGYEPAVQGADDNASALAVCLECARILKESGVGSTMIVLFNREEDGLLGSHEFVGSLAAAGSPVIEEAHVFEMVGYRARSPGSQRIPPGLPGVAAPDVGDFLALLSNEGSNAIADELLALAVGYVPQTPVLALKTFSGAEKSVGHLLRSDHVPFWGGGDPSGYVDGHLGVSQPALPPPLRHDRDARLRLPRRRHPAGPGPSGVAGADVVAALVRAPAQGTPPWRFLVIPWA